ncbi:hypothetical protein Tco_0750106 [Tanacetum coccineum]|uniref:Uncharacterized protein n=1 Tax=Tanacetum coccineum TaxID=301880 RepID=A0ABQ4Z0J4_9ASTR
MRWIVLETFLASAAEEEQKRGHVLSFLTKEWSKEVHKLLEDGALGALGEEVVMGEGVVVTSSSLEMLTNSCLGGIMVSLIFLEGLDEEALVEFIVK